MVSLSFYLTSGGFLHPKKREHEMNRICYTGVDKLAFSQLEKEIQTVLKPSLRPTVEQVCDSVLSRAAIILRELFVDGQEPKTNCELKINAKYTKSGKSEPITVTGMVYEITDCAIPTLRQMLDAER